MATRSAVNEIELAPQKQEGLLRHEVYRTFGPVKCDRCDNTKSFRRRIFHLAGIPRRKWDDDKTHDFLCALFHVKYAIDAVNFRSCDGKFYVDSAKCAACGSTTVVYDILPSSWAHRVSQAHS